MVLVVAPDTAEGVLAALAAAGQKASVIGRIAAGTGRVQMSGSA
jgi:hydrogenase maturation factor